MKIKILTIITLLLLLSTLVFAFSGTSDSFAIDKSTMGTEGDIGSGLTTSRFTTTPYQPGNNDATSNTYTANIGWFDSGLINPTTVFLINPEDNFLSANTTITFACNATDADTLDSITLYHNMSGTFENNVTNIVAGTFNSTSFTINNIPNGIFVWSCFANDTSNNGNFSLNRTIIIDRLAPSVTNIEPTAGSQYNTSDIVTINVFINESRVDIVTATITLPDASTVVLPLTDPNVNNIYSGLFTSTSLTGTYTVAFFANDTLNNINNSETTNFNVIAPPSAPSGATAGGGGGGATFNKEDIKEEIDCTSDEQCRVDETCIESFCNKLFDIQILHVDSPVEPGDILDFTFLMKGMGVFDDDVEVEYWIDRKGEYIMGAKDMVYLGKYETNIIDSKLNLYHDMMGKYELYVKLKYRNYEAISTRPFEVVKHAPLSLDIEIADMQKNPMSFKLNVRTNKDYTETIKIVETLKKDNEIIWQQDRTLQVVSKYVVNEDVGELEKGRYKFEVFAYNNDKILSSIIRTIDISDPVLESPNIFQDLKQKVVWVLLILLIATLLIWGYSERRGLGQYVSTSSKFKFPKIAWPTRTIKRKTIIKQTKSKIHKVKPKVKHKTIIKRIKPKIKHKPKPSLTTNEKKIVQQLHQWKNKGYNTKPLENKLKHTLGKRFNLVKHKFEEQKNNYKQHFTKQELKMVEKALKWKNKGYNTKAIEINLKKTLGSKYKFIKEKFKKGKN